MTFANISKPHEAQKTYRCPCCHFTTLHGRGGFEMCPVCWWEDHGQDNHDADVVRGGPNGTLSLKQARKNFAIHRAAAPESVGKVREPLDEEK